MNKLIKLLSIISFMVLLLFTACKSNSTNSNNTNGNSSATQNQNNNGQNGNKQFNMPDLMGQISSISGSKVTLKLYTLPNKNSANNNGSNTSNKPNDNASQKPQGSPGAPPSGYHKPNSSDRPNGGGRGMHQMEFSGETKEITIPDGITIESMSQGNRKGNPTSSTIAIKDLKVGMNLQIWYKDSSSETISRISVREQQAQPKSSSKAN